MEQNNMREMRKALKDVAEAAAEIIQALQSPIRVNLAVNTANYIIGVCARALEAAPRNCDVGSSDERLHRYHVLCREIEERHERIGEHAPPFAFPTEFEFEDSPYEGDEHKKDEVAEPETPPPFAPCPKCGKYAARFIHPTFDGGTYVSCDECHYAPQMETWASTDAKAAEKWNNLTVVHVGDLK